MVSVIVLLDGGGGDTGMQMWGFKVFRYGHVGAAAVFAGAATHRSVYQIGRPMPALDGLGMPRVVKVAFFSN
jgi:hypothetical protein